MAIYECDWSGHRYPQAQQSIYYTQVVGSSMDTLKLRLCPTHFRASQIIIAEHMSEVDEDSQASGGCEACTGEKVGALFAKVYPAKEVDRTFVSDLCAECLGVLAGKLQVANGRHLADR